MFTRNIGQLFVIATAITVLCTVVYAQQSVYKWTDEDGVVHFSDAPPAASTTSDVETVAIPKAPPVPPPTQSSVSTAATTGSSSATRSAPAATETPKQPARPDISTMSLPDLDLRCEVARERMIAPLRTAEIAECKASKRNDPAWCERFNADFGEGGRNINGSVRPRMFDDLPECVDALRERNGRGR